MGDHTKFDLTEGAKYVVILLLHYILLRSIMTSMNYDI